MKQILIYVALALLLSGCNVLGNISDTMEFLDSHTIVHEGVVERIVNMEDGNKLILFKDGQSYEISGGYTYVGDKAKIKRKTNLDGHTIYVVR